MGRGEDEDGAIVVSDLVYAWNKHRGVVRYVGLLGGTEGTFVGIELDEPSGNTDGVVEGIEYFSCEPQHGLLIPIAEVVKAEELEDAAASVQSLGRKLLAKKKATKERNAYVWNKLDNMNEQLAIKKSLALQSIFGNKNAPSTLAPSSFEDIAVEDTYDGPHLTFPLQLNDVLGMLEQFKQGKELHVKYSFQLVEAVKELLAKEETLQEIEIGVEEKLTVVGDIHGQLQDLFSIFTVNGLPTATCKYLFNGPSGCEVFYSICAFKVLDPKSVFLNRGNHETRQQNRVMGFEEEVLEKYQGISGKELLKSFHDAFDALPLCALIQSNIFVVHGGLFATDGVTFDHIRGMSRKREPPIASSAFEDQLFELSARGAGVEFGQDATHEFLRTNRAALVIRSHECVREGFELLHGGRLITLFSASRYCGLQTNKGAFLTIGKDLQPEIQQFYAHSISETHWKADEANDAVDSKTEEDAINMIIERIIDNKPSLYWHYTRCDTARTGTVSKVQWANGLQLVLQLDLPFLGFLDHLAEVEEDGHSINYAKFLERYSIQVHGANSNQWQDGIVDSICEKMFTAMGAGDVKKAFNHFDHDGNGTIEYEEFVNTLRKLDIGLSDSQIFELMRGIDKDSDSTINLEEFANRFEVIFVKLSKTQESNPLSKEEKQQLSQFAASIYKVWKSLDKAFDAVEENNEGSITAEQLIKALKERGSDTSEAVPPLLPIILGKEINEPIAKKEFEQAFKVFDRRGSVGRSSMDSSSIMEHLEAMGELPPASESEATDGRLMHSVGWQEGVVQNISNFMYQNRHQMAGAFRTFDVDNDGHISAEEFVQGMMAMNKLFASPLEEDQIMAIMNALDEDGDGRLSYKEFLQGFTIVDSGKSTGREE